jgi:hypothetical protein
MSDSGTSTVVMRCSEHGWELCIDAPWGLASHLPLED